MAHYAILDSNNVVIHVTTGKDENNTDYERDGKSSWEQWYKDYFNAHDCKRTSYNTHANTHRLGGTPFRANYPGAGHYYNSEHDIFHGPRPTDKDGDACNSFTLNICEYLIIIFNIRIVN